MFRCALERLVLRDDFDARINKVTSASAFCRVASTRPFLGRIVMFSRKRIEAVFSVLFGNLGGN